MRQVRKYTISPLILYLPFAMVICTGAIGCTHKPTAKKKNSNSVSTPGDISALHESWLNPASLTPLEFLQIMKQGNDHDPLLPGVMLDSFPENWIKKNDIDTLIKLVNSREKCRCFLNPLSSYIPHDKADLGGYAIRLIESYKQKKQLTFGLYACPTTNKADADKLVNWWKQQHR